MSGIKIGFNDLPKGPEKIEEGIYIIEIKDVVSTETSTGKQAFVFDYQVVGTETTVKDYVIVNNEDGKPHNFGRRKLRTLLEKAKIEIMDITPKTLQQFSKGKRLKANIKINKNGYPEVNYDDFYAVDDTQNTALNAQNSEEASKPNEESAEEQLKEVDPSEFETEDI